jgi:outer membrane immunogenic protein
MNRIKLAMLAGTALCAVAGSANATGMPDPWVGYYVGGNLGYSWGDTGVTTNISSFRQFGDTLPGGTGFTTIKPDGVIGGGQIGVVGRLAPHWLVGLETDLQWSGERAFGHGVFSGALDQLRTSCSICSYNNTSDITARLNWFGTVRGRAGFDWNNLWFYGTAGLAYGEVSISGTNTVTTFDFRGFAFNTVATPFSYSSTQIGWVAGFGVEGLIGDGRWRWKTEYLHIDLGSSSGFAFLFPPPGLISINRFTDDIVRVGFNYRFSP